MALVLRIKKLEAMKRLPIALLFLASLLPFSIAEDAITLNTSLSDGQTLISAGGNFELGLFSPGSSQKRYLGIWYKRIADRTIVWVANRDNPLTGSTGYLKIGIHGDLLLCYQAGNSFWSTRSSDVSNPIAQLLDSGNFVLKEEASGSRSFAWQSFDYPSATLLPGMKFGFNFKTGLDRYLITWKSTDDPAPGDYSFRMDPHGSPEFFLWHNSMREFRNGLWNGSRFVLSTGYEVQQLLPL